jgi:hypothetical protein
MKAYWGSGGIAPHIPDLGIRWLCVVSFTPRPLYPWGKIPWYPLDRKLGGEEENSRPLPGVEPLIIQPVAQRYTTELFRLLTLPVISFILLSLLPKITDTYNFFHCIIRGCIQKFPDSPPGANGTALCH